VYLPLLAVGLQSFPIKAPPYLHREGNLSFWGGMRQRDCHESSALRQITVSRNHCYETGHWSWYSFSNMKVHLVQDPVSDNNQYQMFRGTRLTQGNESIS